MKIREVMFAVLLLLAFTLPLSESIKNITLVLFILIGFYGTYKKVIIPKLDLLNILLIVMPIIIIIGSYFALDAQNTIKGSNTIITMNILFIYLRELHLSERKIVKLLFSLFLGFFVTLLWGYYDLFFHIRNALELHSVGQVNHSSIYMLFIFIISLVYLTIEYKKLNYLKTLFVTFICLVSIISVYITGSRATMYTSLGITFIFGIYSFFKFNKRILIFLGFIIFTIGLLFFFNIDMHMTEKFEKGIFNNTPRLDLAIGFLNSWLHHNLLFGIGIDNSRLINLKEYYSDCMFPNMSHAHDTYITYLVERGLTGLIIYLVFIIFLITTFTKKLLKYKNNFLVIIAILIWIANFVISFANTTFHHENAILMLILWAIALEYKEKKDVGIE